MRKRGQVTLFIILGILLLIAVALLIIFREKLTLFLPEQITPTKTGAIERFIETCAEQVARGGLELLGAQGGYVWLPPAIEANPLAHLDTGLKVPLWQYQDENRIPSLPLMEAQLGRYMDENLPLCLASLQEFREQYDIVEKGPIATEVTLADKAVVFRIRYPIDILAKDGTRITGLEQFEAASPVKLKRMHEVASAIMEAEAREMRIEKIAVDLLALDSSIPLTGIELGCSRKVWSVREVEQKVMTLLRVNLPSLRVDFTDYLPVPDDQPYIKNHYVWRVTELRYPGIRAGFALSGQQPFQIAVRPSSGKLLKSNEVRGDDLASFICLQQWNFVYDLRFPVQVSVEDEENDYALTFGFVATMQDNRGDRRPLAQQSAFIQPIEATEEAYCGNTYGNRAMRIITFDNVSDPRFGETHEPVDGVNISFTCLKYTCGIGKTRYASAGAAARLDATFPYCVNGIVRGEKSGYKRAEQFATVAAGTAVPLYLTPVTSIKDYRVVKRLPSGAVQQLSENEKAFISLSYTSGGTKLHESWGGYPPHADVPLPALELLAEADFPYRLEIFLVDEEGSLRGGFLGAWTPDWNELKGARSITFPVLVQEQPGDAAAIRFLSTLEEQSRALRPVIR